MSKTIALANDHAAIALKPAILKMLNELGYTILDLGTNSPDSVDYPDYGHLMAHTLLEKKADLGIIICGTGIGISIAANRHPGIRAALCHNQFTAEMARKHNDANVLALGARVVDEETALACIRTFLSTSFENGRHKKRVEKLG